MGTTNKIVIGAAGFSLFSWLTSRLYDNMTDSVYDWHAKVYEPVTTVSIVIPVFNEEDCIEAALKSILSQNILSKYKDYFECIVVDNESTDRTPQIAKQYCQVISAPRGKLNARDAGIRFASGDIIVSCDADTYYPPNWLNLILRHFHKPGVVAAYGPHLSQGNGLYKIAMIWYSNLAHLTMPGSGSAFLKKAYFAVNGFDLSINQFDRQEMQIEEEIVFLAKLKTLGKVVFDMKACCFTSGRHLSIKTERYERTKSKYVQEIERGERF
jgi:glycosyltransferase involved in cell wall biosynthesis